MIINYDINNKGGGASAEGCLRYDQEQDLTAEQQEQAKENLGIEEPEPQVYEVSSLDEIPAGTANQIYADYKDGKTVLVKESTLIGLVNYFSVVSAKSDNTYNYFTLSGKNCLYELKSAKNPSYGELATLTSTTIPTVNNPTVTINQGGVTKGSFTLNQSGAATINLDAGGEAVQSDWNETDTDDPAFIKNKPEIETYVVRVTDFNQISTTQFRQIANKFESGVHVLILRSDNHSYTYAHEVVNYSFFSSAEESITCLGTKGLLLIKLSFGNITVVPINTIDEAPYDGKQYARKNETWVEVQGGGEAVQSDWNETDTDDPAFIKNKPEIPEPQAAVLYTPQTLTDAQKTQALSNIGAAPFIAEAVTIPQLTKSQVEELYEAFTAGRPTFVKAKISQTALAPVLLQVIVAEHFTSGSTQTYYLQVFYRKESYSINLTGSTVTMGTNAFLVDAIDSNMYVRKRGSWIRLPDIPQPENHQLLKSALSEPMGCSANTWATLAELNVPEDGAYQVSASARMLPADQSTAFKTATVSIELGTDAAGYTEVMEMTLPRSGEYGTLSVPVNATAGQKLRLRAISEANFYAQASPSAGKASATFIAAVRVGAIYQD